MKWSEQTLFRRMIVEVADVLVRLSERPHRADSAGISAGMEMGNSNSCVLWLKPLNYCRRTAAERPADTAMWWPLEKRWMGG